MASATPKVFGASAFVKPAEAGEASAFVETSARHDGETRSAFAEATARHGGAAFSGKWRMADGRWEGGGG